MAFEQQAYFAFKINSEISEVLSDDAEYRSPKILQGQ